MTGEVEQDYIIPIEQRHKLTKIEDNEIPVIDLSSITSLDPFHDPNPTKTDPNIHDLVAKIGGACRKWGFFQVINHSVPLEKIKNLEFTALKFFGLPKEEKRKVKRSVTNLLGYYDDDHSDTVRDWNEGFIYAVNDASLALVLPDDPKAIQLRNRYPENPPEWLAVTQEYANEATKLGFKLLELIALSLELPANRLIEFYKDPSLLVRLNHYLPCPRPDLALGIGPHRDSAGINILYEDNVGGLQVQRKSDGEWISVKPIRNAFVVNIGETLQVWSNDKYESVVHRVVLNPEKERFSISYSIGPAYYVNVKPLEELVDEENPAKYREFNYGAFRASTIRGYTLKPNMWSLEISDMKIPNTE